MIARIYVAIILLVLATWPVHAQSTVTVIGPITVGDCALFNSNTVLKDAGMSCSGGAITPTSINQTLHNTFYNTTFQDRFADRIFMGAAVVNNGTSSFLGGDWYSALANNNYGTGCTSGSPYGTPPLCGIYSDVGYAQSSTLYDPNNPNAILAVPQVASVFAAETVNSPTNASVRAADHIVVNNSTTGNHPSAWADYYECHQVTTAAGETFCQEIEPRNSDANVVWNPYSTGNYGTIGTSYGCGAGLAATGQFPCTVGQYYAANPSPYNLGILFLPGSLSSATNYPMIEAPYNYQIQWWGSSGPSVVASITSDSSGYFDITATALKLNGNIISPSSGIWTPALSTSVTPGTPVYSGGGIQVGTYQVNGQEITAQFNVKITDWTGSPTGNVFITGLPLASANIPNDYGTCSINSYTVTGLDTANYGVTGYIAPNFATIGLQSNSNTATENITAAQAGTTASFIGVCHYHT